MSVHIGAKRGEIAATVLLPGDPMRAKFIADTFLEDVTCYNEVRGMYGYTGTFKGRPVSVQGTGIGQPSISIYAHELVNDYRVKKLIRVGTCGAIQKKMKLHELVLAQGACTDSSLNNIAFNGADYAPIANFDLLQQAYQFAQAQKFPVTVGNLLSTDVFYIEDSSDWKLWANAGVLAIDMESSALYTMAAKHKVQALSILTVSDSLVTRSKMSSEDRETSLEPMIHVALSLIE